MKKTLILSLLFVFIVILFMQSVKADLSDGLTAYYSFDTNCSIDNTGTYNATAGSSTSTSATAKIGNSCAFSGSGTFSTNAVQLPAAFSNSQSEYTFCMWGNLPGTSVAYNYWAKSSAAFRAQYDGGTPDDIYTTVNGGTALYYTVNGAAYVGWHYLCQTVNSTNRYLYFNGTANANDNPSLSTPAAGVIYLGSNGVNNNELYAGYFDEVGWWNRSLTSSEVSQLFNGGAGLSYANIIGGGASNFTVTLFDSYDNIALNNFSISIDGTNYSTTTGSIITSILDNSTDNYNITIYDIEDNGGYFNKSYYNIDVSSNLEATSFQAQISLSAYEKITGTNITSGTFNSSLQSDSETLYLKAGNIPVTFQKAGYYDTTNTLTINPFQNDSQNITGVYDTIITIHANNKTGGENITGFNGWVYNGNYSFNESYNATGGTGLFYGIQNLPYTLYATQANYTTQRTENYATQTPNAVSSTEVFTLYRDKSFLMEVRDIVTNALLDNVTIYLYGVTTYNYTFDNSTFRWGISPQVYDLSVQKSGYGTYSGTIEITDGDLTNTTIYLSESSTTVDIFVSNTYGQYLSNATVVITKASDGAVVATDTTDFSGGVSFDLLSSLNYYINITRTGYVDFYESFNVINNEYTIILTANDSVIIPSYYSGFNYSFIPISPQTLNNETDYNFSFYYESGGIWSVTDCAIYIIGISNLTSYALGSTSSLGTCDALSGSITLENNTGNYEQIQVMGVLTLNDSTDISYKTTYSVGTYYEGDASLIVGLRSLAAFNKAGWDSTETSFLVLLLIISVIGGISIGNIDTIGVKAHKGTITLAIFFLLTIIAGSLNLLTNPTGNNPFIQQYGISVIVGLLLVTAIAIEVRRA